MIFLMMIILTMMITIERCCLLKRNYLVYYNERY